MGPKATHPFTETAVKCIIQFYYIFDRARKDVSLFLGHTLQAISSTQLDAQGKGVNGRASSRATEGPYSASLVHQYCALTRAISLADCLPYSLGFQYLMC